MCSRKRSREPDTRILGLAWVGLFPDRLDRFDATVALFAEAIGLSPGPPDDEVAQLYTPRGDCLEVFRPEARYPFATTGPIPGFLVDDASGAAAELRGAGLELLGEPGTWEDHAWQHFLAPDGHVFEVTSGPYRPDDPSPGLPWVGVRTPAFADMVTFAGDVLGLPEVARAELVVRFGMPNGDAFEVIAEDDPDHAFMDAGPVVAFEVDDVPAASERIEAAGGELLDELRADASGRWRHVRAPDGSIHEVLDRTG
jgi:catechol 2,3-dioxygenase-like lactoylglutathione lyase family enzyme